MSGICSACGASTLRHHLAVRREAGESLVATTTAYGVAPSDLVKCAACGHVQVAEFPAEARLDEAYSDVDEAAYLEEEKGQRATADRALERIERHVTAGSIADLGCWLGFLLSQAEKRGWKGEGVEPSRFAANFARERLNLSVRTGTLESADLPRGGFDAVVMADVIEHLPDPGEALERTAGMLRAGGVVYLALPDAGSAVARLMRSRWWSVLPTHVQYFSRASVTALLGRHGFAVEWVSTAPKAFTVRYYAERLAGYSEALARALVRLTELIGVADRLVWPDFRDRMAVVARRRDG